MIRKALDATLWPISWLWEPYDEGPGWPGLIRIPEWLDRRLP